jgi:hypothetical protein
VNLDAQTFTVMEAGREHLLSFSDVTVVTGTSGAQGLAAEEGAEVQPR